MARPRVGVEMREANRLRISFRRKGCVFVGGLEVGEIRRWLKDDLQVTLWGVGT